MSPHHPITLEMQKAINEGVFPGASLLVSRADAILWEEVYGQAQIVSCERSLTKETLFDIASLTKPMGTATLLMLAYQKKLFSPDDLLDKFRPGYSRKITLRHLLNHSSGLPAWKPFYLELIEQAPGWVADPKGKEWLMGRILAEAQKAKPDQAVVYSDLGYILLGDILEKIHGKPLEELFSECVARPLDLKSTLFNPLNQEKIVYQYAATEKCSWREKILCGEVQDDHAYLMGGSAGHAGLFSTAREIWIWIRELRKAQDGTSHLIQKETFDLFCQIPAQRNLALPYFTLGFDTPSKPSSSGRFFSKRSLGHLGYTGTSFWWDLEKDVCVILLTNRCHPTRDNEKIKLFRPLIHDVVMKSLGLV